MIPISTNSFDDKLLAKGQEYTVGTNDGIHFKSVVYVGTKLFNGKEMMVFQTKKKQQITINPSYHSFTIEEDMENMNHITQEQSGFDSTIKNKEND